ncbi:bifunctional 2-C-methyl-D-erythritol 4-phosphate cytidylyltransferase/2-C-methyl-D-erythritol 2,4-cyclodiphosphate synthase [Paracoccus sp. IB05]|uniref:bifunctional 2-C-methyl-D-erythritol 4-phosphate cytidylyltransferase/2-C-methyl-D-erythritol 2,4-cyclodiphosphate synthase n=1 Tax=Paracoccus sp. IB05 TaxID=2779367 RepID=UPI0018E847A8|nr:bifunctional 2-C-methyl-D-erythritol 4-phosphate cytidylyltransferase/2-C-methyl-D-erythritol 2,4-cyclodiphosphate synthase [Paracoccus sp. IB05]MBJ2151710.1 bifunctional 2-C-methyl-D-erythritol 4-phosphate cytidylyltransferase/2-C-methyl-D-erythritol 2,4-cyclodiphosphate synthase [Paracoccus sp. IB05]
MPEPGPAGPGPKTLVVITAAGRGVRAGSGVPKQWRLLAGEPVLAHTLRAFQGFDLALVIHPEDRETAAGIVAGIAPGAQLIEGGATRAASVRNALEAMAGQGYSRVLIQDGARPLTSPALIARMLAALDHNRAAAPALAVSDALWRGQSAVVTGLQPRDGLWRAQTPQAFHFDAILAAHRADTAGQAADDVELALASGLEVAIVEGEEDNLKLTFPPDFPRAEQILAQRRGKESRMDIRMGNGFDVHAFTEGDHLWLCGVKIAHDHALLGHSDADVGMHALTDAIYGALAEGDIGRHFPPSDPQWKGAASHIFLRHAAGLARDQGFAISNCDVTLICERPKIGPHAASMQSALAAIMGLNASRISVKATTSERLGFTGREEGIASIATVVLVKA